jgi:hypothetical protein
MGVDHDNAQQAQNQESGADLPHEKPQESPDCRRQSGQPFGREFFHNLSVCHAMSHYVFNVLNSSDFFL